MKLWFSCCNLKSYLTDDNVKFGLGWYRHHKDHKWFGFSVQFYLYFWLIDFHFVDNWQEYDKKINHKRKRNK
jgi:hypothetical protein